MGGLGGLFGKRAQMPPPELVENSLSWLKSADIVDCERSRLCFVGTATVLITTHPNVIDTTVLFILPQLTSLIHYFVKRNLRLARARAWDLTVQSRNKPDEFWSKGYTEEWDQPPTIGGQEGKGTKGEQQEKWLSWLLFWPTQVALRHCELIFDAKWIKSLPAHSKPQIDLPSHSRSAFALFANL